jgi:dimethylamine monooxygenase subunit A
VNGMGAAPPAWLDELDLRAGPPWLSMGTRGLAGGPGAGDPRFVADEERDADLARKEHLAATRHAEVFSALPEAWEASVEVAADVSAAIGAALAPGLHPLDAAGRAVQEDLCVLVERRGAHVLVAGSVCFPSYWRLEDKMGRSLAEVHAPVPHYAAELDLRVERLLGRLRPGRAVWRRNWSIHDDPEYHLRAPGVPRPVTAPRGLWLRSERQTLSRLPESGAVLFTIRTQQVPLAVLADRPDIAAGMAAAISAWSPELAAYKGTHGAAQAQDWLGSLGSPTS